VFDVRNTLKTKKPNITTAKRNDGALISDIRWKAKSTHGRICASTLLGPDIKSKREITWGKILSASTTYLKESSGRSVPSETGFKGERLKKSSAEDASVNLFLISKTRSGSYAINIMPTI